MSLTICPGLITPGHQACAADTNTAFEEFTFAAAERALAQARAGRRVVGHRAVVGHRDDQRVLGEALRFQEIHELAGRGVEHLLVGLTRQAALERDSRRRKGKKGIIIGHQAT